MLSVFFSLFFFLFRIAFASCALMGKTSTKSYQRIAISETREWRKLVENARQTPEMNVP